MEKKTFGERFSGAGKAAKNVLDKSKGLAVQVVDRNDDGKLDFEDVSAAATAVSGSVKRGVQAARDSAAEKARALELLALQPIFPDTLADADFTMPKFIRIAERDKKHAESELCQGSIGYQSDQKGLRIVNIFRESADAFGLTFFPDNSSEFYYVDPSDRDTYIALDEYFAHLKLARISELQKLAQDLGAKHFRVTYKEEQTTFTGKKSGGSVKAPGAAASGTMETTESKYARVEIAAESDFPGHAPRRPDLRYLLRDQSVQTLVAMRLDETSPLQHQTLTLQMSTSSGLKESDAVKIDAVLKGMKCAGNASVTSEAQSESRKFLDYEIDF